MRELCVGGRGEGGNYVLEAGEREGTICWREGRVRELCVGGNYVSEAGEREL